MSRWWSWDRGPVGPLSAHVSDWVCGLPTLPKSPWLWGADHSHVSPQPSCLEQRIEDADRLISKEREMPARRIQTRVIRVRVRETVRGSGYPVVTGRHLQRLGVVLVLAWVVIIWVYPGTNRGTSSDVCLAHNPPILYYTIFRESYMASSKPLYSTAIHFYFLSSPLSESLAFAFLPCQEVPPPPSCPAIGLQSFIRTNQQRDNFRYNSRLPLGIEHYLTFKYVSRFGRTSIYKFKAVVGYRNDNTKILPVQN